MVKKEFLAIGYGTDGTTGWLVGIGTSAQEALDDLDPDSIVQESLRVYELPTPPMVGRAALKYKITKLQ